MIAQQAGMLAYRRGGPGSFPGPSVVNITRSNLKPLPGVAQNQKERKEREKEGERDGEKEGWKKHANLFRARVIAPR